MNKKLIEQGRELFGGSLTNQQLSMIPETHFAVLATHPNKREMIAIYTTCIQNNDLMALTQVEILLNYCLSAPHIEAARLLSHYYQYPELLQQANIVDIAGVIMHTDSPDLCSYYKLLLHGDVRKQLVQSGLLFPVMQLMSTISSSEVLEYFFMTVLKQAVISSPYVLRILTLFTMIQTEATAYSLFMYADELAISPVANYIIQLFHEAFERNQVQELMDQMNALLVAKDIDDIKYFKEKIQKVRKK